METKRLVIICEGETEQEFCKALLKTDFAVKGIYIDTPRIKKSMGGIVGWADLKKQIINHLSEGAYVTTFIDYYGIKDSHKFPGWKEAKSIEDKAERMKFLEDKMKSDVQDMHFIPYIQLYEFEALLFNNVKVFDALIPANEFRDREALIKILNDFPNPELINNGVKTSPSHRLEEIIEGYQKVLYGTMIAELIGLQGIRQKCSGFDSWIAGLLNI